MSEKCEVQGEKVAELVAKFKTFNEKSKKAFRCIETFIGYSLTQNHETLELTIKRT